MSEKKNIDKLFKEQFKNFEVTPSDAVWKNIEAKLNTDKRKRRVIPIWWTFAGVAATLLLMFTLANTVFNDADSPVEQNVVDTGKSSNSALDKDTIPKGSKLNTSEDLDNNPIADNEENLEEIIEKNTSTPPENNLTSPNEIDDKTRITISEEKKKQDVKQNKIKNYSNKSIINNKSLHRDAIVSNDQKSIKGKNKSNLINQDAVVNNSNIPTSKSKNPKNAIRKEKSEIDKLIKQKKSDTATQVTSSRT